ncbi:hypothetical protein D3C76_1050750 [compost metagenome]
MRRCHRQVRRHAFAGIVEQRRRCPDPVIGTANDVGALLTQDAWHLGEPDIPANQHADSTNRRIKNRKPQIAGCEPEFLQVPQMRLSILADKTVRADQHRGVEQSHAVALRQAGHEVDVVPAGKIDPQLRAWPAGYQLRMCKGILPTAEEITGAGQLRQHDKIRTAVDRLQRQFQAATQICITIFNADLWIELHDCYTHRACWLAHFG